MDEAARVAMLARVFGSEVRAAGVEVGIGDDAAVLRAPALGGDLLVWTIDEQVEGTHFRRDLASWSDIGWRSLMAAASDVAAMGARARGVLCALVLPDDVDDAALEAIARGQREAADATGAPVLGGNLARGRVLSIVKRLVESHSGTIRIEDNPPRGTAFVVTLPQAAATDDVPHAAPAPAESRADG